jgi:RecB family endonuclease NucS
MPIQHAIWQVGQPATQLKQSKLGSEALLEDMIVQDPRILLPGWMLNSKQEITAYGGRLDLLAITLDGSQVPRCNCASRHLCLCVGRS